MFGPDTALMIDAVQIAVVAITAGAGGAWLLLRRRAWRNSRAIETSQTGSLEDRVRVLERIATDRSSELAIEIESLRGEKRDAT